MQGGGQSCDLAPGAGAACRQQPGMDALQHCSFAEPSPRDCFAGCGAAAGGQAASFAGTCIIRPAPVKVNAHRIDADGGDNTALA